MIEDLKAAFDRYDGEYRKFERIESPRHPRPDICAFLLLHELAPEAGDMVGAAEHDEFWLNVNCDRLAEVATDGHIRELVRCGVRYDDENDSLALFA